MPLTQVVPELLSARPVTWEHGRLKVWGGYGSGIMLTVVVFPVPAPRRTWQLFFHKYIDYLHSLALAKMFPAPIRILRLFFIHSGFIL